MAKNNKTGLQISWTTISYRSVALAAVIIFAVVLFVLYLIFPAPMKAAFDKVSEQVQNAAAKVGIGDPRDPKRALASGPQQAHFTAIDGTVRVKKASGNTFIGADYNLPLERGDVVQTSSEGMARIVFADGTSYTVKQDSLIVIDDNSVTGDQQTQVSVQVTTGTVDLTTATFAQGSKSQVVVAGATASIAPESSAQVRNDPRADRHEILVKKGAGEVVRNGETVRLTDFEKVTFKADSEKMSKSRELGPPTLIGPANMAPLFVTGHTASVQFSWTPMEKAVQYHIRVSKNPYFSSTVLDTKIRQPQHSASMPEGAYYWLVQSIDDAGNESIESEKNRFTVIQKAQEKVTVALDISKLVQHGHVIEVRGRTDPSARVMVNGQEVPAINSDGSFQFLTPPLPAGENVITITAQTSKGAVNTQQRKIVIQ